MCVAMVIIQTKTLEKKSVDDVTSKESLELCEPSTTTMSQGAALFSCGIMDFVSVGQPSVGSSLESLWDSGASNAGSISGLLRDLSLSEAPSPSKRQCRSRSCSEEFSWRSPWRPQASRLWTAVEKRRCHSGGAALPSSSSSSSSSIFASMQRSSSFSFPAQSNLPDPQFLQSFTAVGYNPAHSLCHSHHQIFPAEVDSFSEAGSTDSACQTGGLARSQSQPCVLNDQKIGMKRRRPHEPHKQRPSLDLAKMTQKQSFQSLSAPCFDSEDCHQPSHTIPFNKSPAHQSERIPFTCNKEAKLHLSPKDEHSSVIYESDGDWTTGKEREPPWAELYGRRRDVFGGELDIEQIERN